MIDTDTLKRMKFIEPLHRNGKVQSYQIGWNDAIDSIIENEAEPMHLCENCEHYPYAPRPLDSDKTNFYTYSYCWKFKEKDYCSKWEKMDEVEE